MQIILGKARVTSVKAEHMQIKMPQKFALHVMRMLYVPRARQAPRVLYVLEVKCSMMTIRHAGLAVLARIHGIQKKTNASSVHLAVIALVAIL